MLNSAGSVSAEWYIETLGHYLWKRQLLQGVSRFDVEFRQPARLADGRLHFALPHPDADDRHLGDVPIDRAERVPALPEVVAQEGRHLIVRLLEDSQAGSVLGMLVPEGEIGRASCRERV